MRIRKAVASVGLISVRRSSEPATQNPRPRGSAVIVRADGVVVTNLHVVTDRNTGQLYDQIILLLQPEGASAYKPHRLKTVLINKDDDLALLKIESAAGGSFPRLQFPAIQFGDSRNVRLLDDLFIIGFPEKGGSSVTLNRGSVEGTDALGKWIKTDGRVIHGNSGGAAVNVDGKLIGIPTKVVADDKWVDKDGDGFPDDYQRFGAVGFLRPAHLVSDMLARLDEEEENQALTTKQPRVLPPTVTFSVQGLVKSARGGQPIAGAMVGLIPLGAESVTEQNLLAWGGSSTDGQFKLNKPIPSGRYSLRAKALGYSPYSREIEIVENRSIVVEMNPTPSQ